MKQKGMGKNFLWIVLGFVACHSQPALKEENTTVADVKATQKEERRDSFPQVPSRPDNEYHSIACFIAGMPVDSLSPFFDYTQTKAWKDYSLQAANVWQQFDNLRKKYIAWAEKEVYPETRKMKIVFYPFSGPDFLYVNLFYPEAEKIYMFGLEDVGTVPDRKKITPDSLPHMLRAYKEAISDVINISFFRTNDMKDELAGNIDGTTPVIMLFLARSGKIVCDVKMMTLDSTGNFIAWKPSEKGIKPLNRAVKISYRNPGETLQRHIIYLTNNVSDPALRKNKPYKKFFLHIEPHCGGYVKSATYLMHKSYFSTVRNVLLQKADVILQDDSGIAFHYFDPLVWDIQLYGSYTKPIPLFEEFFEQDLYEAYQTRKVKKLNFRIGYHPQSNLLFAKRKNR